MVQKAGKRKLDNQALFDIGKKYQNTGMSYSDLEKEYGISVHSIRRAVAYYNGYQLGVKKSGKQPAKGSRDGGIDWEAVASEFDHRGSEWISEGEEAVKLLKKAPKTGKITAQNMVSYLMEKGYILFNWDHLLDKVE